MAKETESTKKIFYAYEYVDQKLTLKKRGPFLSWKFGTRYKDQFTNEILFEDSDKDIRFVDGVFVTEDEDQINYLNMLDSRKFPE